MASRKSQTQFNRKHGAFDRRLSCGVCWLMTLRVQTYLVQSVK